MTHQHISRPAPVRDDDRPRIRRALGARDILVELTTGQDGHLRRRPLECSEILQILHAPRHHKGTHVSLDDETYRRVRMIAAQRDTSVSALVKRFLMELGSGETESERLKRAERALRERITAFQASDRLSRVEVHRRGS